MAQRGWGSRATCRSIQLPVTCRSIQLPVTPLPATPPQAPAREDDPDHLPPLSPEFLRSYIAMAREYEPHVPEGLTERIAALYADIRREESESDRPTSYTTARTLLSIVRMSQALARLA